LTSSLSKNGLSASLRLAVFIIIISFRFLISFCSAELSILGVCKKRVYVNKYPFAFVLYISAADVVVCLVVVDVTLLEETVVTSVSETVVVAAVSLEA
jgi:hypothetical protein